ncbi:MAG: response regulator [Terrimicrobiaceae bacterium]
MSPRREHPSGGKGQRPLSVGVVEDNAVTRQFLAGILKAQPGFECVGAWSSAEDALQAVPMLKPNIILVDLELPGMPGEDCLRALSAILPGTALVVLTAHDDPKRVFASLSAGANGYLLKGASPDELVSAMTAAHDGGAPLSPAVAGLVINAFLTKPKARRAGLPLPSLSPREHQILEQLARGRVPKEAAAELVMSYETVRDHLKRIYRKLHVRSRTEAVLRYLGAGASEST